jgi:hypothetical protein
MSLQVSAQQYLFVPQLVPSALAAHGFVVTHVPLWHCCPAWQVFPQLPQLLLLVRKFASQPSLQRPLQFP